MRTGSFEAMLEQLQQDRTFNDCPSEPELPTDSRLGPLADTDSLFSWTPPGTVEAWEARAEELRDRLLVSAGLFPMPEKQPLNAKRSDQRELDGIAVEKVLFESFPGFYVTGNLYRPLSGEKKTMPAVLCPHGHWRHGRMEASELVDTQLRCANFAKLGFVAFSYDMLGFEDSVQVSHGYGGFRESLWSAGGMGLQLWNSIRSLDFLESLDEVDAKRIGCTGESGGGTQTFLLSAIDRRVAVAAPVNMVSFTMQGGCRCENAPLLRIGTNNVELCALSAPRPMLLAGSDGDWTVDLPRQVYPAIRQIYRLYGREEDLSFFFQSAGHNYNRKARESVYSFFCRHLLGRDTVCAEQPVDLGDRNQLRIFAPGAKPEGISGNAEMFALQKRERQEAVERLWRENGHAPEITRRALAVVTGVHGSPITAKKERTSFHDGYALSQIWLGSDQHGEHIPFACLRKKGAESGGRVILAVHPDGKWEALKRLLAMPEHAAILEDNGAIASLDLFLTGDYRQPYAAFGRGADLRHFETFHYTDCACQIQDIAYACRYLASEGCVVDLVGFGKAAYRCLAALPFTEGIHAFTGAATPPSGDDNWYVKNHYLPGFLAIGGFDICKRLLPNAAWNQEWQ